MKIVRNRITKGELWNGGDIMLVVGLPTFIVDERGVIKRQEMRTWEKNPKAKIYLDEIMIPKDVFIECYNKWIDNNG